MGGRYECEWQNKRVDWVKPSPSENNTKLKSLEKKERGVLQKTIFCIKVYHTRKQAKQSIFEYIAIFYNRERIHSTSNYLSPVRFEEKMLDEKMLS